MSAADVDIRRRGRVSYLRLGDTHRQALREAQRDADRLAAVGGFPPAETGGQGEGEALPCHPAGPAGSRSLVRGGCGERPGRYRRAGG